MPINKNRHAVIQRPGTAIGMTPTRPYGGVATAPTPNAPAAQPGVDRTTDTYTFIARPTAGVGEQPLILYNGDRQWAKITLELLSAGPVVIGTRADLLPVLSGKGRLLVTNQPYTITIAKTSRLYIVSTAVNLVAVTIEPLPWLEQLALSAQQVAKK